MNLHLIIRVGFTLVYMCGNDSIFYPSNHTHACHLGPLFFLFINSVKPAEKKHVTQNGEFHMEPSTLRKYAKRRVEVQGLKKMENKDAEKKHLEDAPQC